MPNRVCLGQARGTYGLFVSRPGYDVLTADDAYMSFDSRYKAVFVVARGSVSMPVGVNTATVYFAGLTAPPIVDMSFSYYHPDVGQTVQSTSLDGWTISVAAGSLTINRDGGQYGATYGATFHYMVFGVPF